MKTVGIIPARAGSKRVPNKNVKILGGKPLIAHTIEAALNANLVDRVIVSTDGAEIADAAREWGAEVPFMRPEELAVDTAADKPLYKHALEWLSENEGYDPDAVAILRPTSPLRTPEIIDSAITFLESTNGDSVRSVTKVEGVHHPYWMYNMDEDGRSSVFVSNVDVDKFYQSQLLPPAYRQNGVADVVKSEVILGDSISLYGDDLRIYEIPAEISMDLDTELDFEICEAIMRNRV